MDILTLDIETYYDDEYSLSKLTTEAYIRDPRFEFILVGCKWNDTPSFSLVPERARAFMLREVDWKRTAMACHHVHFDAFAFRHHWGTPSPALYIDTLSMARVVDGPKAGNSLAKIAERKGLQAKGNYLMHTKGKHLNDFTAAEYREFCRYGCGDVDTTYQAAVLYTSQLPVEELRLIDLNARMFIEPVFRGNTTLLAQAVEDEQRRKVTLLERIGATREVVNSNDKFAGMLRMLGVEPGLKASPSGNGMIPAFARTDSFMQSLLDHEDDDVRWLAEARVGVKSNIIETRAQRFLSCAQRGPMPVYLNHGGAHTLRPSGGDKTNWLNMSKVNASRPEMLALRRSIQAPEGHKIVAVDSSQGEARILAWLAGQTDLVEDFRNGVDIYSQHASTIYGRPVDRKRVKDDHIPGQVGKIGILGFGFGCGWKTAAANFLKGVLGAPPIQFTLEDAQKMSVDVNRFLANPRKVEMVSTMPSRLDLGDMLAHCAVSDALVTRYRQRMPKIVQFWERCERAIDHMAAGVEARIDDHGAVHTIKDGIRLPNGMKLRYDGIRREGREAKYWNGRELTHIYGSLLTENIVQCLHRLIVGDQMLRIADAGIKIALWPYDEVVAVVPADAAPLTLEYMVEVMKTPPAWAAGLPLAAEGGVGDNYSEV